MIAAAPPSLLAAALALGFAGSVHCLGMCGGIAAAAGLRPDAAVRPVLSGSLFNLGRVASYGLLGGLVGAVAAAAFGWIPAGGLAVALRLLAALLLLAIGLALMIGRDLLALERLGGLLWHRIRPLAGRALLLPAGLRTTALGLLWGFLPCGLVYSALALAAAAGSAQAGAAVMLSFGAGTLPAMLAVTLGGGSLARRFASLRSRRLAGALMIGFALWTAAGPLWGHGAHAQDPAAESAEARHGAHGH